MLRLCLCSSQRTATTDSPTQHSTYYCSTTCRWKAWPHVPHTTGLSSPGNLLSGGQPSKGLRQMPHMSSPASHVHTPTACHFLISTLKVLAELVEVVEADISGVSGFVLARSQQQNARGELLLLRHAPQGGIWLLLSGCVGVLEVVWMSLEAAGGLEARTEAGSSADHQ